MGIFDFFDNSGSDTSPTAAAPSILGGGLSTPKLNDPWLLMGLQLLANSSVKRPMSQAKSPFEGIAPILALAGQNQQAQDQQAAFNKFMAGAPDAAGGSAGSTGGLGGLGGMPPSSGASSSSAPSPASRTVSAPALGDDDLAIRTIAAETSGHPDETAGIAAVIRNRVASGKWGDTVKDVVLAKNQFEPWNANSGNNPMNIDPSSSRYQQAAAAWNAIKSGDIADPTDGATHFFAPRAQAALGRNPPAWGRVGGTQLGATAFFAPEGRVRVQPSGGSGEDVPAPSDPAKQRIQVASADPTFMPRMAYAGEPAPAPAASAIAQAAQSPAPSPPPARSPVNSIRDLWDRYNQTENPADFARASQAMQAAGIPGGAVQNPMAPQGAPASPAQAAQPRPPANIPNSAPAPSQGDAISNARQQVAQLQAFVNDERQPAEQRAYAQKQLEQTQAQIDRATAARGPQGSAPDTTGSTNSPRSIRAPDAAPAPGQPAPAPAPAQNPSADVAGLTARMNQYRKYQDYYANGLMMPGITPQQQQALRLKYDQYGKYADDLQKKIDASSQQSVQLTPAQAKARGLPDPGDNAVWMVGPDNKPSLIQGPKDESTPALVKEFEYAQKNGYKGTFTDFKQNLPPGTSAGQSARDPSVTGEAFLQTLPADRQAQIKQVVEGRSPPPSAAALRSPYIQQLIADANQYDPTFDQSTWNARNKTHVEFSAGGPNSPAAQITAGNTAIQHLGHLSDAAEKLNNFAFTPLNEVKNYIAQKTGDPDIDTFNDWRNRYAQEITKFYRGTGGNEADIKRDIDALNSAKSLPQLRSVLAAQADGVISKINALQERWHGGMGPNVKDFKIIHDKSQEALDKIYNRFHGTDADSTNSSSAASANPVAAAFASTPAPSPAGQSAPSSQPKMMINPKTGAIIQWDAANRKWVPAT